MAMITQDEEGVYKCPCNYRSPAKWNVERHVKACKVFKAATLNVDQAALAELKASLEAKEFLLTAAKTTIEQLTVENGSLKAEIKELKSRPPRTTVTNITNNITVNLPAIQKIHHLSGAVIKVTLDELPSPTLVQPLLSQPQSAVHKYVELKYFTATDTPSISMPNLKKPELRVVERGRDGTNRWVTADKNETIEFLVDKGIEELEEEYNAKDEPEYSRWSQREGLDDPGFDQRPAYKRMKKDVEAVIIRHRKH